MLAPGIALTMMMTITVIAIPGHITFAQKPRQIYLSEETPKELIDTVWQIVNRQYIDGTFNGQDWQAVRKEYLSRSYNSKQEAYTAIRQMLEKLGDPFTRFIDPQEFKETYSNEDNVGIGLQININQKTKELEVISPIEDTPAYHAGILAGDVLLKINGKSTSGLSTINAVNQIRGKVSTPVVLTIRRDKKQLEFTIVRNKIELSPLKYKVQQTNKGNIGYIRLKQFNADSVRDMDRAIRDLENKQVAGYILDLRSNSGGLLSSIVEIARMWINKGTIVSTVDRNGEREREQANGKALTDKPLVVIINDATISGAEILTAALQENNKAVLVGSKTIGYNTIQSVRPFDDGSRIVVTIAKWRTPKERDIDKLGIVPDIVVNLTSSQQQAMFQKRSFGTMADPQFSSSVEKLTQLIQKN
ncbi:MAG: PDZ domain-containing protein [Richelia sp. SM1_7_0]|nr:PDZ domain-containing protein [Richelia sp. SM1_7_0]